MSRFSLLSSLLCFFLFAACDVASGPKAETALFGYFSRVNKQVPSQYEAELVSAKVMLTCKAQGKYPASYGLLTVKETFNLVATPNSKPYNIFAGGIDYPNGPKSWTQPEISGGQAILLQLKLAGCEIPAQVLDAARTYSATALRAEKKADEEKAATEAAADLKATLSSPTYAVGAPETAPLKAGWSEQELTSFAAGCVLAIVTPARQDYFTRAAERGNSSPKPFPEQELAASVQPMCACIGLRIAQSSDLQAFVPNHEVLSKPFIEEAMMGGKCKPGGLLGTMLDERSKK